MNNFNFLIVLLISLFTIFGTDTWAIKTVKVVDGFSNPFDPGQAGVQNTLSVSGATPNGDVTFLWGFIEGTVSADQICPGLQAGISDLRNLVTVTADGSGNAFFNIFVPVGFAGVSVVLQAVDISSCSPSNANPETL